MKTIIICALQLEAELLLKFLPHTLIQQSPFKTYIINKGLLLCISGLGKVNSAACIQFLIEKYPVQEIYNLGICGSLHQDFKVGDIVLSHQFVQYDFNLNIPTKNPAWHPSYNSHVITTILPSSINLSSKLSILASGDRFICDEKQRDQLNGQFQAIACDMESAAMAQICLLNKVSFVAIRAISDNSDQELQDTNIGIQKAVCNSTNTLMQILKLI